MTGSLRVRALGLLLLVSFLGLSLLAVDRSALAASDGLDPSSRYAINLFSTPDPVDKASLARHPLFDTYILYTTRAKEDRKWWYRLRLGFFPDKASATKAMLELKRSYPEAWVTLVSKKERRVYNRLELPSSTAASAKPVADSAGAGIRGALKGALTPLAALVPGTGAAAAPGETVAMTKAAPPPSDVVVKLNAEGKRLENLMSEAEAAITRSEYARAISLYRQVLKVKSNNPFAAQAQEFLGVARERSGDIKGAKAEYKAYLATYPEGPDSERVRQRLIVLETARAKPKESLKKVEKHEVETEFYGSFSQYYYRDENFTDIGGNVVTRSTLSNDMDVSIRRRTPEYDMRAVFVGGYDWDLLEGADSQTRLSRLYLDLLDRQRRVSTRLGRQSRSSGGVLGRFDGGQLGYQFLDRATATVVAGLPTESSVISRLDTDRYFYGISLDLGTFAEALDMNAFYIDQRSDGISDRTAVGGEVRYFQPDLSFFSLVDYDTSYEVLNILLLFGNMTLWDKTIINFSADYRKTPNMSTTNALVGQAVFSLEEMLQAYTEDEVRALALDRTALSRSYMVGISHPLNEKFQVSGDFTVSNVTGTPDSGGVAATPGTGNEYFYSAQLIGNGLIMSGDIAIIGLRFADTSTSDTMTFSLNTRYPLTRNLRLNPRFRATYSQKNTADDSQYKLTPSMKVDYTWARRLRLEVEGAMEWTRDRFATMPEETSVDYFLIAGYRYDF